MTRKKPSLFSISKLAICLFCVACQKSDSPEASLEIEKNPITLPTVSFGESTKGRFLIKNTSDAPVELSRIGPVTCECESLILHFPDRNSESNIKLNGQPLEISISPHETIEIQMTFDSSRFRRPVSWKRGAFAFIAKNSPPLLLEYEIDIWNPYWVEPWRVNYGNIGPRERSWKTVLVRSHDASEFNLLVPFKKNGWEFKLTSNDFNDTAGYRIAFRPPEEMPLGPFQEKFEFNSNLPNSPPIRFWVQGKVLEAIFLRPSSINASRTLSKEKITVQIFGRGEDFTITNIQWDNSLDIVELSTIKNPNQLQTQLRYNLEFQFQTQPTQPGFIYIKTNHPEHPELTINVQAPTPE